MPVIVIGPNGDHRFAEPHEHEMVITTTSGTDASKIPGIQQPLTAPNTQPLIYPNPPTITPNVGINPFPNIGIGTDPYQLTPPKPLRQVSDPTEWEEMLKSLTAGHSGLSEKERVFEQLCQHIPDEIVREYWLDCEEAQKNPIESGMNFLVKYLLTSNKIHSIL
jgi:hypothetical protein